MGKGLVHICQSCMAAQEVHGKPHLICPSEMGTTLTILDGRFTNMKSHASAKLSTRMKGDFHVSAEGGGNARVKFPSMTRLVASS